MTISPSLANEAADRLAVVDALYRFAAGIDLRDKDAGTKLDRVKAPGCGCRRSNSGP